MFGDSVMQKNMTFQHFFIKNTDLGKNFLYFIIRVYLHVIQLYINLEQR